MPNFDYNRDIPDGPNNPSADQPRMKTNTNSTDDIIDVDHYSFGENNGGLHRYVRMPIGAFPTTQNNQASLYTDSDGETQIFGTSDNGAKEYQLTRFIDASFALFGTYTNNYNAAGTDYTGGWTFLPGGLIFQYGKVINAVTGGSAPAVPFPVAFSSACFSVQLQSVRNSSNVDALYLRTNPGTANFTYRLTGGGTTFFWTAVGK